MQLAERNAEFDASQRRLSDLEKDLVELSLTNETYRAQVATLSTRIDVADSQLKEAQSHSQWASSDLSNVHELAAQLNSQKVCFHLFLGNQKSMLCHFFRWSYRPRSRSRRRKSRL